MEAPISDYRLGLQFCGVGTPDSLPGYTTCPLCRGVLSVHHNPWYYCSKCGFAGDPFMLVERVKNCTTDDAISMFIDSGLSFGKEELSNYKTIIRVFHNKVNAFWDAAKDVPTEGRGLARFMQVYGACKGGLVGYATKGLLDTLPPHRIENITCTDGRWQKTLVIPMLDLPGRLSSYYLLTPHGTAMLRFTGRPVGIVGLSDIGSGDTTVLVFKDIAKMVEVSTVDRVSTGMRNPILGIHPNGSDLSVLSGRDKVFVWDTDDISNGLKYAMADQTSRICLEWRKGSTSTGEFFNKATSWAFAAKMYLLNSGTQKQEAVRLLNMSRDQRRSIVSVCNRLERRTLMGVLGSETDDIRAVSLGGSTIIADDAGYSIRDTRVGDIKRISDVKVTLHTARVGITSDDTVYTGNLEFSGKKIGFTEVASVIRGRTMAWVDGKLAAEGLTPATVTPKFRRSLISIGLLFSPPKVSPVRNMVKVSPGYGFELPHMSISEGHVENICGPVHEYPLGGLIYPGVSATPNSGVTRDPGIWELAIPILANIVAPVAGWRRRAVAVSGDMGGSWSSVRGVFAYPVVTLNGLGMSYKDMDTVNSMYDVPCLLEFPDRLYNAVIGFIKSNSANVIIRCLPDAAREANKFCGFVHVQSREVSSDVSGLPHILADYFRWLSLNPITGNKADPCGSVYLSIREYASRLDQFDLGILDEAADTLGLVNARQQVCNSSADRAVIHTDGAGV